MMRYGIILEVIEPRVSEQREPLTNGDGPFRPNVAGLLLRRNGSQILLGERFDTPGCWQWPQGGLDPGESPEEGLRRELAEEIGIDQVSIRYQFPFKLRYRFPQTLAARFTTIGQEQIYFVVESTDTPDLEKAGHQEFRELKWMPIEQALYSAVWFKKEVYRHVMDHLEQVRPQLTFLS